MESHKNLMEDIYKLDKELRDECLKNCDNEELYFDYGTSGYRSLGEEIKFVSLRVGLLMGYLCRHFYPKSLGIIITASHNPMKDNGLKLLDKNGGYLRINLEKHFNRIVNDPNLEHALSLVKASINKFFDHEGDFTQKGRVFIGMDTRITSPQIKSIIVKALAVWDTEIYDFGTQTTPQVHYYLEHFNKDILKDKPKAIPEIEYHKNHYFKTVSSSFKEFNKLVRKLGFPLENYIRDEKIIIDCSNGVGGVEMPKMLSFVKIARIHLINTKDSTKLNLECGAEYIHKKRKLPINLREEYAKLGIKPDEKVINVSFDGDADRIVYFIPNFEKNTVQPIDGDMILTLITQCFFQICQEIEKQNIICKKEAPMMKLKKMATWSFTIVQTAYSNSASKDYLQGKYDEIFPFLKFVTCPTGVKHLHHFVTMTNWGAYFEPNGHGSMIFEKFEAKRIKEYIVYLEKYYKGEEFVRLQNLFKLLVSFLYMTNQVAGDAMADFLIIQSSLHLLDLNIDLWSKLYIQKETHNLTCKVKYKYKIKTNYSENKIVQPIEIQQGMDKILADCPGTRAFVRPSGTENLVRIFVESDDQEMNFKVAEKIKILIQNNKTVN